MDDTKPAIASTGVWGGVIALIGALAPLVLPAVGLKTAGDQQAAVAATAQLATGVGAALALYGRLRATKRIG
jgi:hypothetical protein